MKIIHTADWHLGKILNGKQLLEDQEYVLNQFVKHMEIEQPDVIATAGDLYDTSYPSKETMGLLENIIAHLNINCLLYTSPSPRDLSTSRMPSSA